MELTAGPELIWLNDFLETCPLSGEPIVTDEVEIELLLPEGESVVVEWPLGWCDASNRWFGMLDDLLDVLHDAALSLDDIEGFVVDGEKIRSGLWMGEPIGVIPWQSFIDRIQQLEMPADAPPPEAGDVQGLPQFTESWELSIRPAMWVLDKEGEHVPSYIALVLDPASGIRAHDLKGGARQKPAELAHLVLNAAARPAAGSPGRPLEVLVSDESVTRALAGMLAEAEIPVRTAPTPNADDVIADMMRAVRGGGQEPYLTAYAADDVKAFYMAAHAFYRARPWDRFPGDKYVAFRIGDRPWAYLAVMGQMGEELGFTLFEDWLQLCRLVHNQPSQLDYLFGEGDDKALVAAGALEGMSLEPLHALHPEDAEYIKALGLRPVENGAYPDVRRFSVEGLQPPHFSLFVYRALMEALVHALSRRRAHTVTSIKQTFTVGDTEVVLRYPARGDENFEDDMPAAFRLVVAGLKHGNKKLRLEISAPASSRLDDVIYAVKNATDRKVPASGFRSGEHVLWSDLMGRGAPCPRVGHLATLDQIDLEVIDDTYAVRVMPLMGVDATEISIRVLS